MRIRLFYHSLVSDWNHGNAHFLRGIVAELLARGFDVQVWEPVDNWSLQNLKKEKGADYVTELVRQFPDWKPHFYSLETTDLSTIVKDADLVLVHEWNEPELIAQLGALKQSFGYRLLFHDTHHRSVTAPEQMAKYDLSAYDGVLAFGKIVKELYLKNQWAERAWVWHEAADTHLFQPLPDVPKTGDLVWVGNWGDDERTEELYEYLIQPVKALGLKATMYGVRYPEKAKQMLKEAGITYGGYLPSHLVPQTFAQYKMTVHVPRRPYVQTLPGIPTIRPFEALACGIPLISSTWYDGEKLFRVGEDFLMVNDGNEMQHRMDELLHNENLRHQLTASGLESIKARHSCAHRVDELMSIDRELTKAKITETL
jgi:spore maturation protein CgeB